MSTNDDYVLLQEYLNESGECDWGERLKRDGQVVWRLLNTVIDTYMDIEEDDRLVLAAWIMSAAFKEGFDTMPILFINGSRGCGKTRLEKLIEALIPNSILTLSLTESALFRINNEFSCLLIDEAEKGQISNKDKSNLTELLNACYKRGGKVIRVEKSRDGLKIRQYSVYNPVVLANIYGLSSIIEDRSIPIVLRKTRNQAKSRLPESFKKDPLVTLINRWFDVCCVGVGCFFSYTQKGAGDVSPLYYNIYTLHTIPTLSYTNYDLKPFYEKSDGLTVNGRDFELWQPLLLLTYTIDPKLTDALISIAQNRTKEKEKDSEEFDRDTSVAVFIHAYISTLQEPSFYPKDFTKYFFAANDLSQKDAERHWLSAEWVGRFISRSKILNSKTRTKRGALYTISRAKLKDYLEARNASDEPDPIPPPLSSQSSLKTQPDANNSISPERPRPEQLGRLSAEALDKPAVCPICLKAKTVFTQDPAASFKRYVCVDCLNDYQHRNEMIE